MEESAINVLKRAVVLDQERRFDQAIVCYEEGIGLLLKAIKGKYCLFLVALNEYCAGLMLILLTVKRY